MSKRKIWKEYMSDTRPRWIRQQKAISNHLIETFVHQQLESRRTTVAPVPISSARGLRAVARSTRTDLGQTF